MEVRQQIQIEEKEELLNLVIQGFLEMGKAMFNNILISEDDSIIEPNVHDAQILGLIMLEDNRLLLLIQATDKSILCFAFNDLDCLRVDDFKKGNIILDITVSSGSEVEIVDIAYVYGLEKFIPLDKNGYLNKAVQSFLNGKKLLVQINPSYGCKVVCVCGGIEVLKNWTSIINNKWGHERSKAQSVGCNRLSRILHRMFTFKK
jgi:hypothetical protein